ncbi:hypothetical protein E4U40_007563 [Claviceps sp. LM458 group G5]|nr:hypothetical protein E4U40_007563 [Claviceps sp. LM458 group G5]
MQSYPDTQFEDGTEPIEELDAVAEDEFLNEDLGLHLQGASNTRPACIRKPCVPKRFITRLSYQTTLSALKKVSRVSFVRMDCLRKILRNPGKP